MSEIKIMQIQMHESEFIIKIVDAGRREIQMSGIEWNVVKTSSDLSVALNDSGATQFIIKITLNIQKISHQIFTKISSRVLYWILSCLRECEAEKKISAQTQNWNCKKIWKKSLKS